MLAMNSRPPIRFRTGRNLSSSPPLRSIVSIWASFVIGLASIMWKRPASPSAQSPCRPSTAPATSARPPTGRRAASSTCPRSSSSSTQAPGARPTPTPCSAGLAGTTRSSPSPSPRSSTSASPRRPRHPAHVPLVAGLAELQPWVEQWHSELDHLRRQPRPVRPGAAERTPQVARPHRRRPRRVASPGPDPRKEGRQVSALLRDVFTIQTTSADYVLRLTESVDDAHLAHTLDDYVVTDELAAPSTARSASSPPPSLPTPARARSSPARSAPARATSWPSSTRCSGRPRRPAPSPSWRASSPGTTPSSRAAGSSR